MHKKTDEKISEKCGEESIVKFGKETDEFEQVTSIVGKVRDAVATLKDSDVSIKNWQFAFDKTDKEYIVEFVLKLAVKLTVPLPLFEVKLLALIVEFKVKLLTLLTVIFLIALLFVKVTGELKFKF